MNTIYISHKRHQEFSFTLRPSYDSRFLSILNTQFMHQISQMMFVSDRIVFFKLKNGKNVSMFTNGVHVDIF